MPAPRSHQEYVADAAYVTTGGATWYFALSDNDTFAEDTPEGEALATEIVGNDGYTTPTLTVAGIAWDAINQKVNVVIPDFTYTNGGTTTIQANAIMTVCCPSGHTRKVPAAVTQSSFDGAADTITITNHGYVDGNSIVLRVETGTLDSALSTATIYEVINSTANTFQVTLNGIDPIDMAGDGASLTAYVIDGTLDARSYTYKQFASPVNIPPSQSLTIKYSHGVDTVL